MDDIEHCYFKNETNNLHQNPDMLQVGTDPIALTYNLVES